ncbi:ankyrin repeat-containing domain protein [Boletus coccyginus]|nr:ankyrin repeat-containing domain protein [Boletus coccyginus]
MIPFLVDNGVNILAHANNGDSVLHIVLQSLYSNDDALQTVKLLVGYGCDPLEANSRGNTPLHIAVGRGHISTAQYLLTLGAHLPPDLLVILDHGWSRWITAPMIHFLVENGVNVLAHASNGDSVLHIMLQCPDLGFDTADSNDGWQAVRLLISYGCDSLKADPCGNTPLHIAVKQGHISIAQYPLTLGAQLPSDLLVTLHHDQSYWSTAPMIHLLVENGVDVLARASDGDSVLHIALRCSNTDRELLEAVKLLVSYGCDPLEANPHGNTPFHVAVEQDHVSIARYLLTLGAHLPPDLLVSLNCDRPCWGTPPMIHLLVENGVDVLARTSDRCPVLHIALQCSNAVNNVLDVVKLLVGYGCDPLEASSRGETPLHIAAE